MDKLPPGLEAFDNPATMLAAFTESLRVNFQTRLQRKTGWGKNEVLSEFDLAITETVRDLLGSAVISLLAILKDVSQEAGSG